MFGGLFVKPTPTPFPSRRVFVIAISANFLFSFTFSFVFRIPSLDPFGGAFSAVSTPNFVVHTSFEALAEILHSKFVAISQFFKYDHHQISAGSSHNLRKFSWILQSGKEQSFFSNIEINFVTFQY
jgi:hypothetical protein